MTRTRSSIMLAHPAESNRISKLGQRFLTQPKLNGVRCYSLSESFKSPTLYSSTSRPYPFLQHIQEQLSYLSPYSFDGELYIHTVPWNEINSLASRTVNPTSDIQALQFHIFDIRSATHPQWVRTSILEKEIQEEISSHLLTHIKIVPTQEADLTTWRENLSTYMSQSYEGIIFRSLYGTYETKRSTNLLKFKPTCTDIYQIISLIQGTGWCYDRLGAFLVQDKHGNQFEVGTGPCLTKNKRLSYWLSRHSLEGSYLLVKHEDLKTANGFPQCAVAMKPLTEEELQQYKKSNHNDLN